MNYLGILIGTEDFSPSQVSLKQAKEIVKDRDTTSELFLVTNFSRAEEIASAAKELDVSNVQLYAGQSLNDLKKLRALLPMPKYKIYKAFSTDRAEEASIFQSISYLDGIIFDSPEKTGGKKLNYLRAYEIKERFNFISLRLSLNSLLE